MASGEREQSIARRDDSVSSERALAGDKESASATWASDGGSARHVLPLKMAQAIHTWGWCSAGGGKYVNMKFISLSCLFAIATLACPELTISNAHASASFDGAWSVQITMDHGNCDPINRLTVDIRDGAMQYGGDSAVSIRGQVVGDGQVRVRLTHGDHRANGSGRLSANSGTGTWHGTGVASSCAGRWSAERL